MTWDRNRSLNRQERFDFAATLAFLGIVTFLACNACAATPVVMPRVAVPVEAIRTARDQHDAMVLITVLCWQADLSVTGHFGSGVVVSPNRVLTAAHVAACDEGTPQLFIDAGDGDVAATTEIAMRGLDVARLVTAPGALARWFTPLRLGPIPDIGEHACEAAAAPRTTYRCFTTQASRRDRIGLDGMVEHGNSGAGLYVAGRLVGIVVTAGYCELGAACLGGAAPLQDYPWLIP